MSYRVSGVGYRGANSYQRSARRVAPSLSPVALALSPAELPARFRAQRHGGSLDLMRPSAVLFDAGGTLVLQDPARMAQRLGHPVDPNAAFEAHYRAMAEFSSLRMAGDEHTWDWWLERYFTYLGHPDPSAAGALIDRGFGFWAWPIPGVAAALEDLRQVGIRVAVISNSDGSVEGSLAEAGLAHLFEAIIDSEVVGVKKPDPEIFHLTVARLGLDPETTWYVGDSEFHDVGGARRAGLAGAYLIDPFDLHPGVGNRIGGVAELPGLCGIE